MLGGDVGVDSGELGIEVGVIVFIENDFLVLEERVMDWEFRVFNVK